MAEQLRQFFEIYPADTRATRPLGMRVNDVVYANGLAGVDPVTGAPARASRRRCGSSSRTCGG